MSGWWSKATEAQKLAQIDGGIDCEFTARQIALASGTTVAAIYRFVQRRGISLPDRGGMPRRAARKLNDRAAYLRGEPVNLWGNTEPQDEFALDEREGA